MKTVVLLPDGIGVRNFVLGPFLELISQRGPVHALHQIPEDLLGDYTTSTNGHVQWHPLHRHQDEPISAMVFSTRGFHGMAALRRRQLW